MNGESDMSVSSPAVVLGEVGQRSKAVASFGRKAVLAIVLVLAANQAIVHYVRGYIHDNGIVVGDQAGLIVLDELRRQATFQAGQGSSLSAELVPFAEVDAFDDDAKDWSNMFSQYMSGVLLFDANGDGRTDVYFCQDGQNWTRPTDADGVLLEEPRYQHNGLYLNQGNNDAGHPIFVQISDLVRGNDTYVKEELLVEDYLFPRNASGDSEKRWGRQSAPAVAADFNADGRLDLLVGNALPGMLWSHPKTQHVLWQFTSPVGRRSRYSKQALTAMGPALIDYQPRHNLYDKRESARAGGWEYVGANSLYINAGDKDGDGIPEWQDVSRQSGIEGFRNSVSISVGDVDLDGDLDVFVANVMDGDYFPAGAKEWAGGANQLYVNQLVETGKLEFEERASEMDVDGVYDEGFPMPAYYKLRRIPFLPKEYSLIFLKYIPYQPEFLTINGQEAEHGQISWASTIQDVNGDGYPDIWVANDFGFLRLYLNQEGRRFRRENHTALHTSGHWMTLVPADFNGDLKEDLFAGNLGGAILSHAFSGSDPFDLFDPVIESATISSMFINGMDDTRHVLIAGGDHDSRLTASVKHSTILPPDASLAGNRRSLRTIPNGLPFDPDSLDPYEFAWGATSLDVQNDGLMDLYYHGSLYGRGGGISAILGTCPGRLLVNTGGTGRTVRFLDLTAEHHLLNIQELKYDRLKSEGYVYRPAPSKNWSKRDVVYSYDRSAWTNHGPSIQQKIVNNDLIQTSESGRGAIAGDLNGDGAPDILLRNNGGYDSRSPTATNLKVKSDGRAKVVPAHSYHYPVPTSYEPGSSRVFINQYTQYEWIKVRLIDDSAGSFNRDAIGARVIVNGRFLRIQRSGEGSFASNKLLDLSFGLGEEPATAIEVHWPDKQRSVTRAELDFLARGTLTVHKATGAVSWAPWRDGSRGPVGQAQSQVAQGLERRMMDARAAGRR